MRRPPPARLARARVATAAPVLAALVLGLSCGLSKLNTEMARIVNARVRPNLLLVYADDHAQAAISAYGSGLNSTPAIDRLAAEGVLFERSFVCNSICAPARAAVLTGLHAHANGLRTNADVFDGDQRTFPKLLQEAGYQTALIGKWHLKSDPTGFDHWEVLEGQGPYYAPELKTPRGTVRYSGHTTEVLTERALDWLGHGRDPERPFLLLWQHKAPHREWSPGPRELHLYEDVTLPEPSTLFDDWRGRASGARTQEMTLRDHLTPLDLKLEAPGGMTAEERAAWDGAYGPRNAAFEAARAGMTPDELLRWRYQRYVKDYLRTVAGVDRGLERVLDWLDAAGLAARTVVVYSSDQGFHLGEHGWYDKRWMYEPSLSTPLIVRWPTVTDGGRTDRHLVQNIDLAPTFLELAGLTPPDDLHGRSLVPLLWAEDPADWRRTIYYRYYEFPGVHAVPRHRGVRDERYKLIHYHQLGEWELFDLERDPRELSSVHAEPAYADVRRRLEAELVRLARHFGDRDPL